MFINKFNNFKINKVNNKRINKLEKENNDNILKDSFQFNPDEDIEIIQTNDLHGYIKRDRYAKVASIVKEIKKQNPKAIYVDVGDISYSPPAWEYHFKPFPTILKIMKVDIETLGNHEFQSPVPVLKSEIIDILKKDSKISVLSANIIYKKTNKPIEGTQPYTIKDINGTKVAFIGVVTPRMATSAHPDVGADVKKEPVKDTIEKYVEEVKEKGAEVVVVTAHEGVNRMKKIAESVKGIDIILAAHDHYITEDPMIVNGVYIIEMGSHAKLVGDIKLDIDPKTHKILDINLTAISVDASNIKPDPEVKKILENYKDIEKELPDPDSIKNRIYKSHKPKPNNK